MNPTYLDVEIRDVEYASGQLGNLKVCSGQLVESYPHFPKLLDSEKTSQRSEPSRPSEPSAKQTDALLPRSQLMRKSNNTLTEPKSLSRHRSSSFSSQQLSSVPAMDAAASMSASSSPGKPVSAHSPHTPVIPSHMSANSIAGCSEPRKLRHRSTTTPGATVEDAAPRWYYPHARRPNYVAEQSGSLAVEDDLGALPFGIHPSNSLGADDREPPSLSALLGLGLTSEDVASPSSPPSSRLQSANHTRIDADAGELSSLGVPFGPRKVTYAIVPETLPTVDSLDEWSRTEILTMYAQAPNVLEFALDAFLVQYS
jgi:autophagy-related protein 13